MLSSSLSDYSHASLLIKGTIKAINSADQGQANNGTNVKVIFKIVHHFY